MPTGEEIGQAYWARGVSAVQQHGAAGQTGKSELHRLANTLSNNLFCFSFVLIKEKMGPTFFGERLAGRTGPEEDLQSGNVSGLVCASASVCLQRDTAGESASVWGLIWFCVLFDHAKPQVNRTERIFTLGGIQMQICHAC